MKHLKINLGILIAVLFIVTGCKKYLEAKSNQSLVIISTLEDLQALFEGGRIIDQHSPNADIVSGDDYYLSYTSYLALPWEQNRNMYIWKANNVFLPYTGVQNDWSSTYNAVYIANTVIDNITKIERTAQNAKTWDNVKGQALFLRAHCFLKLAGIFCLAYDEASSSNDLGLPLRLSSDFNETSARSNNAETYNQIITDLKLSVSLLPEKPLHPIRASKAGSYALLARTYLLMRKYELAGLYADSALKINSTLINYNTLNPSLAFPVARYNAEVIYNTQVGGGSGLSPAQRTVALIDTDLENSYTANDLRKTVFFSVNANGTKLFKGSYFGSATLFNGIATDEVYLTRAECYARNGNIVSALNDLNLLLVNRYKTGTFIPYTASTSNDALALILAERRKELILRGTRWMDIKRLNKEGYNINLQRNLNNIIYTLPANDLRFALAIPSDVISLSGMQQNPR